MPLATKSKTSTHHKKAAGKHHKTTKSYLKTYWPYIPLAAIVVVGLLANSIVASPGKVLGASADYSPMNLLTYTNSNRAAVHESPLRFNSQLADAAQAKANDMVSRNYWSHDTPDGETPWSFIDKTGYNYIAVGENLAYGFNGASSILNAWMHSEEHRANLLSTTFEDVGFGIANSANFNNSGPSTVVVAMFGAPVSASAVTHPQPVTAAPAMKSVARVDIMSNVIPNGLVFVLALIGTSAVILLSLRHGRAWHKFLIRGEDFLLDHIWLDMLIVSIAMGSYILVQNVGIID
ncbi:MAG TPA: CAP domain-containing protein [Candidatus Saccharimonadales bacterium]|nr:CAP domain-containing protein [Candidatus Saccharimonadales bacterium]